MIKTTILIYSISYESAEDITSQNVILSIFTVNKSNCGWFFFPMKYIYFLNNLLIGTYDLSFFIVRYYEHQEYMFLKVHPSQKFVYLFADWFILSFDIDHLKVSENTNMTTIVPDINISYTCCGYY